MKLFFKKFGPVLLTLVLVALPLVSLAQGSTGIPIGPGGGSTGIPIGPGGGSTGYTPQNDTCAGGRCSVENPLQVSNFCELLRVVLNALIIIGLPVAVIFLVLVGFQFIMARGNSSELDTAKRNLLHTVIGIAIFLGAWTIAEIIKSTLQALGVTGFGSC